MMLYPSGNDQEKDMEWLQAKLKEVDWDIKRDLVKVLETQQGSWRDLVGVLPDWLVSHIPVPQLQHVNSPSEALMQKLEQWGFTVAQLISCLETLEMENALLIIKPDVELTIIEDLESHVDIEDGETLQLACRATGFPTPYYQWYKDGEELIQHQHRRLVLQSASHNDAGVYYCKMYTTDRITNEEQANPVFSNHCQVNILEPLLPLLTLAPPGQPPEIELQPRSLGDILPPGGSITLECKATGDLPISYKWFRDQEELHGETESKLNLNHLIPDETTGKSRWQYVCLVTNPYGQVMSDTVIVGLSSSKKDTYFSARDKVALLIANENYQHMQSFNLPSSDVATLSEIFKSLKFRVMSYVDLTLSEMNNAVHHFCSELDKGAYGFFYFAGHGFAVEGQSYMQPVDATDSCRFEENVCEHFVASEMQKRDPALSFLLLDMCREKPVDFGHISERRTPRCYQEKKYKNIFIGYATSFLGEAVELEGATNGLFVQYLKRHLAENKSICEMMCAVKEDMSRDYYAIAEGQDPDISFNISERRTLRDPLLHVRDQKIQNDQKWLEICSCPPSEHFKLGTFRFVVTFSLHKGTFCNAIDVDVHFKDSRSPVQAHTASLEFWPKHVLKVLERKPSAPEYLKYTLKGLQALKEQVKYQVTLKTSVEYKSDVYSFDMAALSSLRLSTNNLSDFQHYL